MVLYLFPCGINRNFRSFPICQGLHDPEERSLGFLTGLSCRIQLIWKSARGAEEQSKLDSVQHHPTLLAPICQTRDIFCGGNMRPHQGRSNQVHRQLLPSPGRQRVVNGIVDILVCVFERHEAVPCGTKTGAPAITEDKVTTAGKRIG